MISSQTEYAKAREELQYVTHWLSRLESEKGTTRKGLTTASVRKMIARLQEELAKYEAAGACTTPDSKERSGPNDDGGEEEA